MTWTGVRPRLTPDRTHVVKSLTIFHTLELKRYIIAPTLIKLNCYKSTQKVKILCSIGMVLQKYLKHHSINSNRLYNNPYKETTQQCLTKHESGLLSVYNFHQSFILHYHGHYC